MALKKRDKSPACPYCQNALASMPQRKSKCPHCAQQICVKRPFGSRKGTVALMTVQQADEEGRKWTAATEMEKWIVNLAAVGISKRAFEQEHQRLGAQDNGLAAAYHLLSAILGGESKIHRLKMATAMMAQVAKIQGRDLFPFKQAVYRLELEEMRPNAKAVTVTIRTRDPRTGPQCYRLSGQEFSIDVALAVMPLPCGPDCICSYRPIFKWE